jgi:hypothetical protein
LKQSGAEWPLVALALEQGQKQGQDSVAKQSRLEQQAFEPDQSKARESWQA